MPVKEGHYTNFDVMRSLPEWDDHTQKIVQGRLQLPDVYANLTVFDVEVLKAVCMHMTGEQRPEVLQYAVVHVDQQLSSKKGESQRKKGTPPLSQLIKEGICSLELTAKAEYMVSFLEIREQQQLGILENMYNGTFDFHPLWQGKNVPAREWFQRLLGIFVSAVYSHPEIWSEIGYAGPAYPRGYVRVGLQDVDPWEAKMDV